MRATAGCGSASSTWRQRCDGSPLTPSGRLPARLTPYSRRESSQCGRAVRARRALARASTSEGKVSAPCTGREETSAHRDHTDVGICQLIVPGRSRSEATDRSGLERNGQMRRLRLHCDPVADVGTTPQGRHLPALEKPRSKPSMARSGNCVVVEPSDVPVACASEPTIVLADPASARIGESAGTGLHEQRSCRKTSSCMPTYFPRHPRPTRRSRLRSNNVFDDVAPAALLAPFLCRPSQGELHV